MIRSYEENIELKFIILLFFLLTVMGCGKFTYSAYMVDVSGRAKKLNSKALESIIQRQNKFSNKFKVVVTADTHNYYSELSSLVNTINEKADEYAFMIIVGDISDIGLYSEYEMTVEILSALQIPWIVTIGNHDLLNYGKEVYEFFFGNTDFQVIFKDARFVFFNNNNWEENNVPNFNWVEEKIKTAEEKFKILVGHIPFDDSARFTKNEIEKWSKLLGDYKVDYYLNGHNHNPGISYIKNTLMITAGSPVKAKYLELTFDQNSSSYAFIDF